MGEAYQSMVDGKTKTETYTGHVTWTPRTPVPRLPAVCGKNVPQPAENHTYNKKAVTVELKKRQWKEALFARM